MVTSRAAISMVANIAFPPSNIRELVEYARANPGKLAYGSNGIGGIYHLEMEMLKQAHQLDIAHIPYKGGTDSLLAAVAGTIPIAFAPAASAMSQVRAGKVKILAILDYQRVADFPDVPSMGEQFAGYEKMSSGVDMYGPAGLPSALVKRLYGELAKAFNQPDVRQRMKEISFPYDGTGPDEMLATRIKELSSSARAIKAAGLKPE
jgi:tripartite-type tricarboxylate transporter receptor subunit TctC